MSKLVFNRDGGASDEYGHLLALSRLFGGNVIQGLNVTQAASPNMTVLVQPGTAFIPTGTSPTNYAYMVGVDTTNGDPVTISTANASNPRIDTIVLYVDKSVTPSISPANNPTLLKSLAVAGTPAASPTAPSGSTIQTAVGAANPYIVLANVTVSTNATQITTSNIADARSLISLNIGAVAASTGVTDAGTNLLSSRQETIRNFVASGGVVVQTSGLTTSFSNIVYYVAGTRYTLSGVANRSNGASKDIYIDITAGAAAPTYTEVSNNTSAPALAANSVRVAKVVTNASAVTAIQQTMNDTNNVPIYPQAVGTKTTDANGWTQYESDNYREFRKRVTFSQTISGATTINTLSSTNLPVGLATLGNYFISATKVLSGNAYNLDWGLEMSTSSAAINITAATSSAASVAYSGFFDLVIVTN